MRLQNFVNGTFTDTSEGRTSDVVDPSTGETYAQAPLSSAQDVDVAMQAAGNAFEGWRDATPAERSLALLKIAAAVEARAQEFADVEGRNTGKPIALTMSEELPPIVIPSPNAFRSATALWAKPATITSTAASRQLTV